MKIIDTYGPTEQKFYFPYLLAKGPQGELIVGNNSADTKHLVVFDKQLQYLRVIGSKGNGNGKFEFIRGIAVDNEGVLYVSDGSLHCIQKFILHNGQFISQFGKKGTNHGEFNQPAGLLISHSNMLFVCDRQNHRIQVFQFDNFLYEFGQQESGSLNEPVDLTFSSSEQELFVTDWRNDSILVFTPIGKFLRKITAISNAPHALEFSNGIFFIQDGHLLVGSKNNVLILKEDGTFVAAIQGKCESMKIFEDCIGVIMMNNGNIVISDGRRGNNRLIVF